MAEILPKIYRLIWFLHLISSKKVPRGTFPFKFNTSNLENVPYGTYQSAGTGFWKKCCFVLVL